jgi:uncharacterized membrane protein
MHGAGAPLCMLLTELFFLCSLLPHIWGFCGALLDLNRIMHWASHVSYASRGHAYRLPHWRIAITDVYCF